MTSHTRSQYVASLMTSDAPTCARSPWSVEALPGQHINITLWDFTTVDDQRLSASSSLYGNAVARPPPSSVNRPRNVVADADAAVLFVETGVTCRKYAVVQDGARQLTLCGGSRRLAGSYVSRESGVRVWIVAGLAPTDRQRFLLQFAGLSVQRRPIDVVSSINNSVNFQNILLKFSTLVAKLFSILSCKFCLNWLRAILS